MTRRFERAYPLETSADHAGSDTLWDFGFPEI